MDQDRLVVVSNRLPVVLEAAAAGEWLLHSGSGGLVTALQPVLERRGGVWCGWPGVGPAQLSEIDRALRDYAQEHGFRLAPVALSDSQYELFYVGFSNEVLWPLFHDLQSRCTFVPEYWQAYLEVNRCFADTAAALLLPSDFVWVQDYHLVCVGDFLRQAGSAASLGFFLHIPFPPPDIFAKLPWRSELLQSLLAYDVVGFQTVRDRRNFSACVRALLPEARVRGRGNAQSVGWRGRTTKVGSFPIGIDARGFAERAASPEVQDRAGALRAEVGVDQIVLGVDRLDYTKGIPFKFEAIRRLFKARPEFLGRLRLVQILVPSRSDVPEYARQKAEVERLVGEINGELGEAGWAPIRYLFRSLDRDELIAYYRAADCCLATPLKDGMNLVAKEYCACHAELSGSLVLSEFAGAAAQLGDGALLVNPYDILGVAERLAQALDMPTGERKQRMARLRRSVLSENVFVWVDEFLARAAAAA